MWTAFMDCTFPNCTLLFTAELLQEVGCLFNLKKYALKYLTLFWSQSLIAPLWNQTSYEIPQLNLLDEDANRSLSLDWILTAGSQFLTEE